MMQINLNFYVILINQLSDEVIVKKSYLPELKSGPSVFCVACWVH